MSKRFTDTEMWDEDWFIELPKDYKLLWQYIKDRCNHAGIWRCNVTKFNMLNKCRVNLKEAFEIFNQNDCERIIKVDETKWLLTKFFCFQYGSIMNLNNPVHKSISDIYNTMNIKAISIRGLLEVKERSIRGQEEDSNSPKDIDKDKDIDKLKKIQEAFYNSLVPFIEKYGKETIREFYDYWSEPNLSNTKIKKQMQKTWSTELRLKRWDKNKFNPKNAETVKKLGESINS